MNFRDAEAYLYSLGNEVAAMKLGLGAMRALLAELGDPQEKYLKVQVAGTNGKGSVCAFLDAICNAAGIRTGTFTSPHLVSITERVRIDGENIREHEFARHAARVRRAGERLEGAGKLETIPTFFEQVTAIALSAFAEHGVQVAILETGLGGRLDATTAANAEIAAISRIDLDHREYLGDTIEKIAAEKAGIIHRGSKVVIGEQDPRALDAILNRCREFGIAPSVECVPSRDTELGLPGRHQFENAKVAILVAGLLQASFPITEEAIVHGLESARHPGRLEYQGKYLFDGAHNAGGARALAEYLDTFERRPVTIVFGAMQDKAAAEMLGLLVPAAEKLVLTQPDNERAIPYTDLLESLPVAMTRERVFATDNVSNAIEIAEAITPADGIILITGSLYLIGEVKKSRAI